MPIIERKFDEWLDTLMLATSTENAADRLHCGDEKVHSFLGDIESIRTALSIYLEEVESTYLLEKHRLQIAARLLPSEQIFKEYKRRFSALLCVLNPTRASVIHLLIEEVIPQETKLSYAMREPINLRKKIWKNRLREALCDKSLPSIALIQRTALEGIETLCIHDHLEAISAEQPVIAQIVSDEILSIELNRSLENEL